MVELLSDMTKFEAVVLPWTASQVIDVKWRSQMTVRIIFIAVENGYIFFLITEARGEILIRNNWTMFLTICVLTCFWKVFSKHLKSQRYSAMHLCWNAQGTLFISQQLWMRSHGPSISNRPTHIHGSNKIVLRRSLTWVSSVHYSVLPSCCIKNAWW